MRIAIAVLCAAACFSMPLPAQETPTKAPAEDLVTTAKAAKAKRKKSATKVITNKDVRKAKGKLVVLKTPDAPVATPADKTGQLQKQDVTLREHREARDRVAAAQKRVDGLQKELEDLEQRYYRENDPNYRDNVIQERFAQTKRQLDDARHELADARDTLQKISPQR